MIIKSSQRTGANQLAAHLTKTVEYGETQTVTITGSRQLLVMVTVDEALDDMALMAAASPHCQKHLYHVSISPNQGMTTKDWAKTWHLYEQEFGLTGRAYIEVTHGKGTRPPHKHRVYERVDETGKALLLSHTKVRNEKVARLAEYHLGHPLTIGKHNRAIAKRLREEGQQPIVQWLEQSPALTIQRPVAVQNHTDHQQAKRTGMPTAQVQEELAKIYHHTPHGQAFRAAIAAQGYTLARGDRRDMVIVDANGGVHSPRRRLQVKAKVLQERWADIDLETLPSVAQAQQQCGLSHGRRETSANLSKLRQDLERTKTEIKKLSQEQAAAHAQRQHWHHHEQERER